MNSIPIHIEQNGLRLDAVPAVHFRVAFAEEVNRLCSDPSRRPQAIAVELGAQTAAAAAAWLSELCAGPAASHRYLPCMLGIAKSNRRIRASARDRAEKLQRAWGRDLHDLPPGVLREQLGYSSLSLLYLSPTDSIIEAIRCALELGLPLYGVDLEESAEANRSDSLIEDPSRALGRIKEYVARNGLYADNHRDEEVDSRRELAMAARLKTVLARHKHVLFTGGLAHWPRLERSLRESAIKEAPAEPVSSESPPGLQRVVVHPLLAIYHMDVFPAFAGEYEQHVRKTASTPSAGTTWQEVDIVEKFSQLLTSAYKQHFAGSDSNEQLDRRIEDLDARSSFEQLMTGLSLLDQTRVPNLFTALIAAQGTMSPLFCERLADILMKFPWAKPDDFPELPVLAPAPAEPGDYLRGELLQRDGDGGYRWKRGQWVYVHSLAGRSGPSVRLKVPWEWGEIPEQYTEGDSRYIYTWPPTTRLVSAMSFQALRVARAREEIRRAEPFSGSLNEGIDLKATLRAQSRGDDQIFVRDLRRQKKIEPPAANYWDPVVWVFRPGASGGEWDFMADPLVDLIEYASDPDRMEAVREKKDSMIEQVGFGRRSQPGDLPPDYGVPPSLRVSQSIEFSLELHGILLYTPPHFNGADNCAFAENSEYQGAPFCTYASLVHAEPFPHPVREMFRKEYHLEPDVTDWPATMVRMAIPFAKRTVTVVAPDNFTLPRPVLDEALRQGKTVQMTPQSYFPRETLRQM